MQVGEAVAAGVFKRSDGTQEIEWNTVCPDAGFERLNVVTGECRVAVVLDRPERGAMRRFQAVMGTEVPPRPGDKLAVEFFPSPRAGRCPLGWLPGKLSPEVRLNDHGLPDV